MCRKSLTYENEQLVLSIAEPLLTLVKLRVVRIVVFRVLPHEHAALYTAEAAP
jgi:hypothetical protein